MSFDTNKPFIGPDLQVPIFGSTIASGEIRENESAIATNARGTQEPVTPAQLRGDVLDGVLGGFPLDLSATPNLKVQIDALGYQTIDLTVGGSSPSTARTLNDIVARINAALQSAYGTTDTYAYNFEGYLLIRSINTNPSASKVRIDVAASGDAKEKVFGFAKRGISSFPYQVVGTDATRGRLWHQVQSGSGLTAHDQRLQLKTLRPARLKGVPTGPFNLAVRRWVKITVDGTTREIDCAGGTPAATTLTEVVSAINTAFGSTVATNSGSGLVLNGVSTDPLVGVVQLDRPSKEDATGLIFGFATGFGQRQFDLYPIRDTAVNWNTALARQIEGAAGFGAWGPPVQTRDLLTGVTGEYDGEQRSSLESRVSYSWHRVKNTWVLAAPQGAGQLSFDSTLEVYKIRHANPAWYEQDANGPVIGADVLSGDLVELRDVRRSDYPTTTSAGTSLARVKDLRDSFFRSSQPGTSLGTSTGADVWSQKASASNGFTTNTSHEAQITANKSDYAVLGTISTDGSVAIAVAKTANTSADASVVEVGVLFRASDFDNGYVVSVDDRGNGRLFLRTAGVNGSSLFTFSADPALDGTPRTLRVRFQPANNNQVDIYWGGSLDPTDWAQLDEAYKVGTFQLGGSPQSGSKAGIYGLNPSGSGRTVRVDAFIARDLSAASAELPGLPPIYGSNLRGIITSVTAPQDTSATGVVNDCTPDKPMQLKVTDAAARTFGVVVRQDTSLRGFLLQLGGPALQALGHGLHVWMGHPTTGVIDNPNNAGSNANTINVGPGAIVVPTVGVTYPAYELRYITSALSIADITNPANPPIDGSLTPDRYYYLYVRYDAAANLRLVYARNPPNAAGIYNFGGVGHRFVASFFYGTAGVGGQTRNSIRLFHRQGDYVRLMRPAVNVEDSNDDFGGNGHNGISGGFKFLDSSDLSGGGTAEFDLGDSGFKLLPKTTNLVEVFGIASADDGDSEVKFRLSAAYGKHALLGIDRDNDAQYTLPIGADLKFRVHRDAGVTVMKAGIIGYYENPYQLPGWLG